MIKKIGIISDTHRLIRTEVIQALKGCELIIHAGDVGKPDVIDTLKEVAPVIAIAFVKQLFTTNPCLLRECKSLYGMKSK